MQNRGPVLACFSAVAVSGAFMMFGPRLSEGDQRPAVRETVDSYVQAFARGDGDAACDRLTVAARNAVIGMSARVGATDCPSAMRKTREIGGAEVRSVAAQVRVRSVHVEGGKARVTLRAGGQDSVAELERVGRDWKISSLPKA